METPNVDSMKKHSFDGITLNTPSESVSSQSRQQRQLLKGFTLIELLVVIAIIGILASVVMAGLNSARVKSRDAARLSQMDQVAKAIEHYYSDNGEFPASGSGPYYFLSDVSGLAPTYISQIPEDPRYGGESFDYKYATPDQKSGYTLLIRHEGEDTYCRIVQGDSTIWSANFGLCNDL